MIDEYKKNIKEFASYIIGELFVALTTFILFVLAMIAWFNMELSPLLSSQLRATVFGFGLISILSFATIDLSIFRGLTLDSKVSADIMAFIFNVIQLGILAFIMIKNIPTNGVNALSMEITHNNYMLIIISGVIAIGTLFLTPMKYRGISVTDEI